MPLPNQGGAPLKTRLKGSGDKVQLTVPHRGLMSLSRATLKLILVPMGRAECPATILEALTYLQLFLITLEAAE
jgi:hypothetical protein